MLVISRAFSLAHAVHLELFLHFFHTRCFGSLRHITCIQIICPFFYGAFRHSVEVVHLQDVIFRIQVAYFVHIEFLPLERTEFKQIAIVYASEFRLAMVYDVGAFSKREINDIHAIHLADVLVALAFLYIFRHELRRTEKHTLEICVFRVVLHLNEKQFTLVVLSKHVHTIIFVVLIILITFTLKHLPNFYFHSKQRSEQSFQNSEVCLLSEQAFHCPVKTYVFILCHNDNGF